MLGSRKRSTRQEVVTSGSGAAAMTVLTPVIAAHGGAGATTLCRWLGYYAQDWGMAVPPQLDGGPVMIVARGTAHGSARATELVRYLLTVPNCGRIVLAVVGDGLGAEPTAARARLHALGPHISDLVRVPYVARWRYEDDPLARPAPDGYRQALQELQAALDPGPDPAVPTRRTTWAPTPSS